MKSANSSASNSPPSPRKKPATLSVSELLTNSEVARLQQHKRELSDYARKAFTSNGK